MVKGIEIVGCDTLRDAVNLLEGNPYTPSTNYPPTPTKIIENASIEFSEVKGHERLIEYISIAAAGGHNIVINRTSWLWEDNDCETNPNHFASND